MQSSKVASNFFSMAGGQIVSFVTSFLSITMIARYMGVLEFGRFGYLLAVTSILSKVIDFGFSPVVFRELSKEKHDPALLNEAVVLRFYAFCLITVAFNFYMWVTHSSQANVFFANLLMLNILVSVKFGNIRELIEIPFKVRLRMLLPSVVFTIENCMLLAAVSIVVILHWDIWYFYLLYFVVNVPGFLFLMYILRREYGIKIKFFIPKSYALFSLSFSVYVFILFNMLFHQIDIVLVEALAGKFALGIYSAAMRLSTPLLVIPAVIIYTVFPLIVRNRENAVDIEDKNSGQPWNILGLTFKSLYLVPFLVAALFMAQPESLVRLIYGKDYNSAKASAEILLWAMLPFFHSFGATNVMIAYEKQKLAMFYAVALVVVDTLLCFLLIPLYGVTGAAIAKLAAVLICWLYSSVSLKRCTGSSLLPDIRLLLWSASALAVSKLLSYTPMLFALAAFPVVMLLLLLAAGVFSRAELSFFLDSFKLKRFETRLLEINDRICVWKRKTL